MSQVLVFTPFHLEKEFSEYVNIFFLDENAKATIFTRTINVNSTSFPFFFLSLVWVIQWHGKRDELLIEIYLSGKHTRNRQRGNACSRFNEKKNELKMTREKKERKKDEKQNKKEA